MSAFIKICGLTSRAAVDAAAAAGATHAGFNFFPKSPRALAHDKARGLVVGCPPELTRVALVVDAEDDLIDAAIAAIGAQAVQLHGGESPERVAALKARTRLPIIKAIPVAATGDAAAASRYVAADMILFDAKAPAGASRPGGNGAVFDWSLLSGFRIKQPWLLSGGLDAGNVAAAIAATRPPGVDVASGVESAPGVKDTAKIAAFAAAARAAFAQQVGVPA